MAKKKKNESTSLFKIVFIALLFSLFVRYFIFSPIIVDGPSMQPTLLDKDQMIVNKLIYRFKEPERFDVVIFHATDEKDFIKRVIGLPGEHVQVKNNELYINGTIRKQSFLENHDPQSVVYPMVTNDFTLEQLPGRYEKIPEGFVLVLGDNRSNSTDSRSIGLVPMDEIIGKTNIIYWPLDRMQIIK